LAGAGTTADWLVARSWNWLDGTSLEWLTTR
jgi:hypothetical protein